MVTVDGPLIDCVVGGVQLPVNKLTAILLEVPLPHVFVGVTITVPATPPKVIVMLLVVPPAVTIEPAGTVQV